MLRVDARRKLSVSYTNANPGPQAPPEGQKTGISGDFDGVCGFFRVLTHKKPPLAAPDGGF